MKLLLSIFIIKFCASSPVPWQDGSPENLVQREAVVADDGGNTVPLSRAVAIVS